MENNVLTGWSCEACVCRQHGVNAVVLILTGWSGVSANAAAEVSRSSFGRLASGTEVGAVTLHNSHGIEIRLIALGASVQSIRVPDRRGVLADIALGYDTLQDYQYHPQFFGATVGRVANRLAQGRFVLDGRTYQVSMNDGPNSLHGGTRGFDKVVWTVDSVASGHPASVVFSYRSAAGEQGYPGNLHVSARYSLNERDELAIDYQATTDRPTIVNITNHTYFNLAGPGSPEGVMAQTMMIPAAEYTPVDAHLIPTGEFRAVAGSPLDFRAAKPIGRDLRETTDEQLRIARGFDHNFVISRGRVRDVRLVARAEDPASGRVLEVLSDQPGVQFYSGNFLDGTVVGKGGHAYRQRDAFALEPQAFPDTPNQPTFGSIRLAPGEHYESRIVFRFLVR